MCNYYLAIDIGASSGRLILGNIENKRLCLEEVYRFDNKQLRIDGHDCWDISNLKDGIISGLKKCKDIGKIPKTIGIDTWAVDYVLLDKEDNMIGAAVAYRDSRTDNIDKDVENKISFDKLYEKTGIQKQKFNTIYQLSALKEEKPEELENAETLLMIPDYLNFFLTGIKKQEYTNATTTALVNADAKTWDRDIIDKLELPQKLFTELSMPGEIVGKFSKDIAEKVGFSSTVILPATHDTGSAFLAVPARDDKAVYLSSGTWSLLGVENEFPITTKESMLENFTNEGGAYYRFRYLKNIMGLWMIQSIRRELNGTEYVKGKKSKYADGKSWSFPDLIEAAKSAQYFTSAVDVNDDTFLAPESMIDAIKNYCMSHGLTVPSTVGEIIQCVYLSLAECYRDAIENLSKLTGKEYTSINIVGGGCQDNYLNEMTAKATGLEVFAGPVEGTAIGNLIIQLIAGGDVENLQSARSIIKKGVITK